MDKTKHYYTLCRAASPIDTPPVPGSPVSITQPWSTPNECNNTQLEDDGFGEEHKYLEEDNMFDDKEAEHLSETENNEDAERKSNDTIINTLEEKLKYEEKKSEPKHTTEIDEIKAQDHERINDKVADSEKEKKEDQGITHDSPSGLHYRAGDEPEPIDLTHLNIEAAMMCLASKVRLVCGKSESPSMSSRTFRFKEIDSRAYNTKNNLSNPTTFSRNAKETSQGQNCKENGKLRRFLYHFNLCRLELYNNNVHIGLYFLNIQP